MRRNGSGARRRRGTRAAASVALLAVTLGGCATPPEERLSADIRVSRSDPDAIQVAVTNGGADAVTVTSLELDTAQFSAPSRWPKSSTVIRPGTTVDLPVAVPGMACDAEPGHIEVRLSVEPGEHATLVAPDDERWLPRIVDQACLAEAVRDVADVTITALRPRLEGHRLVGDLDITVTPTGGDGTLALLAVHDTVLLALLDPATGTGRGRVEIGRDVRGGGDPQVITVTVAPARCDAHALAEDKRGTIFMLEVGTTRASGLHAVAAPDDVRGALYRFVTDACAT